MKKTAKAFTLVEMLIVIVIIGILIASLMPRMARKNDLSQIQTAIITSQADRGAWPGMVWNTWKDAGGTETTTAALNWNNWLTVSKIAKNLQNAWMTAIPTDPNGSNDNYWLWSSINTWGISANYWQYIYMVWKRNWVSNAWFALMAKTEVEWSSNWVTCLNWTTTWKWYLTSSTDLAHITLCSSVTHSDTANSCVSNTWACIYNETAELRYLLLY